MSTQHIHRQFPPPGPVSQNLIANVEQIRRRRGLSYRKLSARLADVGHPILPSGLHSLSRGKRRVDVDELVALAAVLDTTPDVLLGVPDASAGHDHAALRAARDLAQCVTEVLAARAGAERNELLAGRLNRALRRVQLEAEELLEERRATR